MSAEPITITVDGRELVAQPGQLLIEVAERAGIYIPRFCYHPRMASVGMCRMCLVEIEGPRGKALLPACYQPIAPDMKAYTQETSAVAKKAQEGVLEFLLINHPLDCPVCDRGGECPLQDHTLAFGPGDSRFIEEKRHYDKPIPIADLVLLDRERCILCARCTRFGEEISGDVLLEFQERGNNTQVLTFPDEPYASYFSGNIVQICPVGALLATPYRFKARPWDLESVETSCTQCAIGCRIAAQSSSSRIVRHLGVDSDAINHGWLCDKGRYSYEHVYAPDRITTPLVRREASLAATEWHDAMELGVARLQGARVAFLGGARGTNEDAFAFARLAHDVFDGADIDARIGTGLPLPAYRATGEIGDLESAETIVTWGVDLKEELPILYLRVRRAVTKKRALLIEVAPGRTGLSGLARSHIPYRPGAAPDAAAALEAAHAATLGAGKTVFIVGGSGRDPGLAEAGFALAARYPGAGVLAAVRRANERGAVELGCAPGTGGRDTAAILTAAAAGELDALVLFGADPVTDFPDADLAQRALRNTFVVACDLFPSASVRLADVVFPVTAPGEASGSFTNLEGRVLPLVQKVAPAGSSRAGWQIFDELSSRLGTPLALGSLRVVQKEIVASRWPGVPLAEIERARDGVLPRGTKVALGGAAAATPAPVPAGDAGTPAGSPGVFRVHLAPTLFDDGDIVSRCPSLAQLAPAPHAQLHPDDLAGRAQVVARVAGAVDEAPVTLPAGADDRVARGVVIVRGHALPAGLDVEVGP